jgi:hypothetical protein
MHTWIGNGESADTEVFTAGGSQIDVVAGVVMHTSLGQHGVVFGFTLSIIFFFKNNKPLQMSFKKGSRLLIQDRNKKKRAVTSIVECCWRAGRAWPFPDAAPSRSVCSPRRTCRT